MEKIMQETKLKALIKVQLYMKHIFSVYIVYLLICWLYKCFIGLKFRNKYTMSRLLVWYCTYSYFKKGK